MISLSQDNLSFSGAFLILVGFLAFSPILFSRFDKKTENDLRSLITFHFAADILFIISISLIQNFDLSMAHFFLAFSCIFRVSLVLIAASNSILFTHMNRIQIIFLLITTYSYALFFVFGDLYARSDLSTNIVLAVVYGIFTIAIAWKMISYKVNSSTQSVQLVTQLHKILQDSSRLAHRLLGPILIEWLALRVLSGILVLIRMLLRFISYASVQRTMLTSILISIFTVLYFLRQ